MNRFVFLLGFLLMALMTVTLQAQKIIPLWQNNMPNSKGIVLKDSVVRERVVQVGIPAVHVYEPSKAERTGTAVLIIPGGGYVKLAHEISGIALAKWYNTLGVTAFVLIQFCYPKVRITKFIPTSLLSQPKKRISCKTDFYMQLRLG